MTTTKKEQSGIGPYAIRMKHVLTRSMPLFLFAGSVRRHPSVDAWMRDHADELGAIARYWFEVIRNCGDDVRELVHDGYPTACVGEAAFAYVGAFKRHVNVGFFHGAELPDEAGLLEGIGKNMRHVKVRSDDDLNAPELERLIHCAYADMKQRLSVAPGSRDRFSGVIAAPSKGAMKR